ncbi:uncharacterized protein BJ171DRAFT_496333 [Polychytrium aggregatum]|uniref:uncharacterized protein n=1 Tax=Polychytrium aggregatum TaxID=110093 RepID=UPI0022FF3009|nr:uncharacterized protein BJ171DRAFT_496333 [Polychytrium aggregatum]KAI9206614.1 hypothetical protein BJ171DRAFT_496333 [Polychytrium aggregatum]
MLLRITRPLRSTHASQSEWVRRIAAPVSRLSSTTSALSSKAPSASSADGDAEPQPANSSASASAFASASAAQLESFASQPSERPEPSPQPDVAAARPAKPATPFGFSSFTFPLPSLFNKEKSVQAQVMDYPWLLSTAPPRQESPTVWSVLKEKHFLALGIERAKKHLHYPAYDFPMIFTEDIEPVVTNLFATLSDRNCSEETLQPVMIRALVDRFLPAYRAMQEKGQRVEFVLCGKPVASVTGLHFTYGPYPAPPDYVTQHWWNFLTLMVPEEDGLYQSHSQYKALMQRAMDDGVYMKINCRVKCDLEFILWDKNDIPLVRDRRQRVDIQFISPHFTPWDEIFDTDDAGKWHLKWAWRVSDIDDMIKAQQPPVSTNIQIDWRSRQF